MENKNETFKYSYSASEQEEIKYIRSKYAPKEADPMEQLRRLDAATTRKGTTVSLVVGILSTLVMGAGMSCVMTAGDEMFIPGIIIGILGIVGVAAAYPLYVRITKKERERLAPEILRLTDELMK